jgi:hypothetical protein
VSIARLNRYCGILFSLPKTLPAERDKTVILIGVPGMRTDLGIYFAPKSGMIPGDVFCILPKRPGCRCHL